MLRKREGDEARNHEMGALLTVRKLEKNTPIRHHVFSLSEPAQYFYLIVLLCAYCYETLGELTSLHRHIDERLVLGGAQDGGNRNRQNILLGPGVEHGVHEHVLFQQTAWIARNNANGCRASRRIHYRPDIGNHAARSLGKGGVGFVDRVAYLNGRQVPVEDMSLYPYCRDFAKHEATGRASLD